MLSIVRSSTMRDFIHPACHCLVAIRASSERMVQP